MSESEQGHSVLQHPILTIFAKEEIATKFLYAQDVKLVS